jgi:hypothetical protein
MTGTAWTEREEFHQIYGLDVLVVPTHMDMVRADRPDIIYKGLTGKFRAAVEEIEDAHADGRPVLVGTVAIETSELLSDMLRRTSTCRLDDCAQYHQLCPLKEPSVLNAKQHEREAHIVAMAGVRGAVTIATNMAADRGPGRRGTHPPGGPRRLAGGARPRDRRGWTAHHRHGAARVAAHRQPAARPRGPPGRPRQLPLLRLL